MRKALLVCVIVSLVSLPAAFAQLAATRFINLTDTPASVTFDASGIAQVRLDPQAGRIISVAGYRKVSVMIGTTRATSFSVIMGKGNGASLAQAFTRSITQNIQTFDVVGPEMSLWLRGGPPNATEQVQLWIYLSS
jgi:hypothetical protein